jgi:hypothetical protein
MKSAENGKRGKKLENRLQELLDQATTECMGVRQVDHARLINSIIEECIVSIQMTMSRGIRDDYYRGQYDAVQTIKKRFDIE